MLRIRIRMDQHHFRKPNPDTHQKEKSAPEPYQGAVELWRLKMKPYMPADAHTLGVEALCKPEVADSDHLYEDQDLHQQEKREIRIRNRIMRIRIPQAASKTFIQSKQTTGHLGQHNTAYNVLKASVFLCYITKPVCTVHICICMVVLCAGVERQGYREELILFSLFFNSQKVLSYLSKALSEKYIALSIDLFRDLPLLRWKFMRRCLL